MKYNQYDIEDFLMDPDFIAWVKGDRPENESFFQEWINSTNEESRERALMARELLFGMKRSTLEPSHAEYERTLNSILSYQPENASEKSLKEKGKAQTFVFNNFFKVAATILLFIGVGWFYLNEDGPTEEKKDTKTECITRSTTNGNKLSLKLPDGSMVKLNAGSKITFPKHFSQNRKISLEGEAFFDVVKNKHFPFIVNTEKLKIKVLGTSFNVKSFPQEETVEVAVLSGKVMTSGNEESEMEFSEVLTPNEVISFRKKTGQYQKVFVENLKIYWKDNILVFKNAAFHDVIKELERWYGYEFIFPGGDFHDIPGKINGTFSDKSLEKVIEGLQYSLKFKAKINTQKKQVIIHKTET
ncbi:FecR family protein [Flexithrix dorotheae]|uniref:FecR family protein n=1 Tax=Flexithrix dorotheae TaxID=70993 RepID=UPI00037D02B6|nr:FecR family protein [Flexithrix dorotheae]